MGRESSATNAIDGEHISPASVDTDDIPIDSWERWAPKNIGFLNNGVFRSHQIGGLDRGDSTIGDGAIQTTRGVVKISTGSGSGAGSSARTRSIIYSPNDGQISPTFSGNEIIFGCPVRVIDGPDNHITYITLGNGSIESGDKGFGFKIINGELQGLVHDGTAETTTTLIESSTYSPGDNEDYIAEFSDADREARYFVNGTQEGSISSGLPVGTSRLEAEWYIENTTDTEHRMWFTSCRLGVT